MAIKKSIKAKFGAYKGYNLRFAKAFISVILSKSMDYSNLPLEYRLNSYFGQSAPDTGYLLVNRPVYGVDSSKENPDLNYSAPKVRVSTNGFYIFSYKESSESFYHSFTPEVFLLPSRPKTKFVDDKTEIIDAVKETFELMMDKKMPKMAIYLLNDSDFKLAHSVFGKWNNGILGFSLNKTKEIFIRENSLDAVMLVIGHEIGHILTPTLSNKHDEEAKAFAFSVEWANTIKNHNIAGIGSSIKDVLDFEPARNGLHDIAFAFVSLMMGKGRKAIDLHDDLTRKYLSVFDKLYF